MTSSRHRTAFMAAALLLAATPLRGQSLTLPPGKRVLGIVDTIIVAGNEKTMAYVILDEMTMTPGSVVTAEAIQYDRSRIYSLGLFTSVEIFYDSLGTQRFLYVEVRERWYVIPVPILGFRDGDPNRIYFGGGLLHTNFRGRNQKLYGSVVFGFDPALSFSLGDPLFDRDNNLSVGVSLSTSKVRNRSIVESELTGDFDERHYDVNGTIGKRFSIFEIGLLNLGIHAVTISSYRTGRTASSDGEDIYLYGTLNYTYDSRDLREYATRGSYLSLSVTKNGFGESKVDFSRLGIDARTFVPMVTNLSMATRLHATVVSGSMIPTYARAYYGTSERIRGYYKTVWEGENLAGASLEFRYALLPPQTFVVSAVPLPAEFAVWQFGVNLALFADAGLAWFRHDRIQASSFESGYGGGIHFQLPYGFILRTEYAWNDYGVGQFIIDLRTSF